MSSLFFKGPNVA